MQNYLFPAFVSLALLIGCSKGGSVLQPTAGTITGMVVDGATSATLRGVSIVTTPASQALLTDSNGHYSIAGLTPGQYAVTASKPGYSSTTVNVAVPSAGTITADIILSSGIDTSGNGLNDGLVLSYPFAGNTKDVSGRGHDGTNSDALLATDRNGIANNAYQFDGQYSLISAGNPADLNFGTTTDFTAGAWLKLDGTQPDYAGVIAKQHANSGDPRRPGFQLVIRNGNRLAAIVESSVDYIEFGGELNIPLNDGKWHYGALVVSRSKGLVTLYIDGVKVGEHLVSFLAGTLDSDAPFEVGRERTGRYYFKGWVDDIRVYRRALSDDEVAQLAK